MVQDPPTIQGQYGSRSTHNTGTVWFKINPQYKNSMVQDPPTIQGQYGSRSTHNTGTVWFKIHPQYAPDVIMTDWNRSNTGFTAKEASRQHSCNKGSFTPDIILP